MKEYFFDSEAIKGWCCAILVKAGLSIGDAGIISGALTTTSLWGIDSHGIARVTHYLSRFETGSITKEPVLKFEQTGAATGQLDGDNGHGIVIMQKATEHAIELARQAGVGVIGVQNSSHCGAIGLYTRQVTAAGMVGIAFTHSDALVVPYGGKKAFFGTNPISIAFPTTVPEEPICLDMATSIVPWNYIMNAKRENEKVPAGLGVDEEGNDSVVANDIVAVKPMAAHKGYAMAFLIDMLCGPLNGMAFGPNITPMYQELDKQRKLGSLVLALDPARFGGRDTVTAVGTAMIEQVKKQGDTILFPGQPEYISNKKRLAEGIPVSEQLAVLFKSWSDKLGVDFPFVL